MYTFIESRNNIVNDKCIHLWKYPEMGRKKIKPKDRRSEVIPVRVTPRELKLIQKALKASDASSLSEWCQQVLVLGAQLELGESAEEE